MLVCLLVCLSIGLILSELVGYFFYDFPHALSIGDPLLFLYGPLIYFFTLFLTGRASSFEKLDFLHLIPFVLCIVFYLPTYLLDAESKIAMYQGYAEGIPFQLYAVWLSACFHNAIYLALSVFLLSLYRKKIKSAFSNIERINLSWLKYILITNAIIWLVDSISLVFSLAEFPNSFIHTASQSLGYLSAIFIYFIGYRMLKMPEVFSGSLNSGQSSQKYARSGLDNNQAKKYIDEILTFMDEEQPYLNADLSLSDLCELLSIPNNHMSQVINEKLEKNFFDFVNYYRVEEAKQWLSDPQRSKATMLAIAFESGFKSKSTFNSAFKKHTGITPSQYKKSQLQLKTA